MGHDGPSGRERSVAVRCKGIGESGTVDQILPSPFLAGEEFPTNMENWVSDPVDILSATNTTYPLRTAL